MKNIHVSAALALLVPFASQLAAEDAASIIERSRQAYAALSSYADTASIETQQQPPGATLIVEKHGFRTLYEAPRKFLLDFREDERSGADRFVIWCDGGDFNTWWSATTVHDVYPPGQGANAFALGSLPTKGAALLMAPVLFHKAGLKGPLVNLANPLLEGIEDVDGAACYRIAAGADSAYRNGRGASSRPTTVWIDRQTRLVRKIVEETPSNYPSGAIHRVISTFQPQADPALAESEFRFEVAR